KQALPAKKLARQGQRILDFFQCQRGLARRNPPQQRNRQRVLPHGWQPNRKLDRPRLPRRPVQQAFAFDQAQMLSRRIDAPESKSLANLLERGNDALPSLTLL